MSSSGGEAVLRGLLRRFMTVVMACLLTLACFMVLPLIQALGEKNDTDTWVRGASTMDPEPEEDEVEQEEPEEPEEEEQPEESDADSQPLDLSQLELALNPGMGGGWMGGALSINLDQLGGGGAGDLFELSELDQEPQVIYQAQPVLNAKIRQRAPGTVTCVFVVSAQGAVEKPLVRASTDPVFNQSALNALKKWKFQPAKKGGKPVSHRMQVDITFPKRGARG